MAGLESIIKKKAIKNKDNLTIIIQSNCLDKDGQIKKYNKSKFKRRKEEQEKEKDAERENQSNKEQKQFKQIEREREREGQVMVTGDREKGQERRN